MADVFTTLIAVSPRVSGKAAEDGVDEVSSLYQGLVDRGLVTSLAPASGLPRLAPLGAPSGLALSSVGDKVQVSWSSVPGAASYIVLWTSNIGTPFSSWSQAGAAGTSFTTPSLSNGYWFFTVLAVNADGGLGQPAEVQKISSAFTPLPGAPLAPVLKNFVLNVQVWGAPVAGALSYAIYHSNLPGQGKSATRVAATVLPQTLSVPAGSRYVTIAAISASGEGPLSPEVFAMISGGPLVISPLAPTVSPRGSRTFSGSGGYTPYIWSLLTNNSGGTLDASTGVYTAGSTPSVTDVIQIADTIGDAPVTTNVTVGAGVSISPGAPTVSINQALQLTASGGSGTGYVWSLTTNSTGGSITSGGLYTAGGSSGTDVVQCVDSLGNSVTANVSVVALWSALDGNTLMLFEFEDASPGSTAVNLADSAGLFPFLATNKPIVAGLRGNALRAPGPEQNATSGQRTTIANAFSNEWTWEGWYYFDSSNTNPYPTIFGIQNSGTWNHRMFLLYILGGSNAICYDGWTANGGGSAISASNFIPASVFQNRWTHFAVRRRKTSGAANSWITEVFVDGLLYYASAGGEYAGLDDGLNNLFVNVAGDVSLGASKADTYRFSNKARSYDEIAEFCAMTRGTFGPVNGLPNLWSNNDFENGLASWTGIYNGNATQTVVGASDGVTPHGGSSQLRVDLSASGYSSTQIYQANFTGAQYRASAGLIRAWLNIITPATLTNTDVNRAIYMSVFPRDAGNNVLTRCDVVLTGSWSSGMDFGQSVTINSGSWVQRTIAVKQILGARLAAAGKTEADVAQFNVLLRADAQSGYPLRFMVDDLELR